MVSMPAPLPSLVTATARQGFERLQSSPRPGPSGMPSIHVPPGALRGVQSFDHLAFIEQISKAICSAWGTWQSSATIVGVIINGVTAVGGTVIGPPWEPLILAQSPASPPAGLLLSRSIAAALGSAWLKFTASMKVPGLPWYPAFAAIPMPVAPPTPNIPTPIATLTMDSSAVSKSVLKSAMITKHPGASSIDQNLYDAVADAFEKAVQVWKATTMVTNVLGTGPVPGFAPPYVPVGTVVGGVGIMPPGGFT